MSSKLFGKRQESANGEEPRASSSSAKPATGTRKRRQRLAEDVREGVEEIVEEAENHESVWLDGPLALTILPPVASYLTGGDFFRDGLVLALLFYYLRALIKTPWELYLKARERKPSATHIFDDEGDKDEPESDHVMATRAAARSELRLAELVYLGLCLLTPLLGTMLLKYGATLLNANSAISWFSTGLFVLATGVRPWRHLVGLLTHRTEALHDVVHAPIQHTASSRAAAENRISKLEQALDELREQQTKKASASASMDEQQNQKLKTVIARLEETVDGLEERVRNVTRTGELVRLEGEERHTEAQRNMQSLVAEIDGLHRRVQSAAASAAAASSTANTLAANAATNGGLNLGSLAWQPPRGAGVDPWNGHGGKGGRRNSSTSPTRGNPGISSGLLATLYGQQNGFQGSGAAGSSAYPANAGLTTRLLSVVFHLVLLPVHFAQNLLHKTLGALNVAASPPSPKSPNLRSPRTIDVTAASKNASKGR